MARWSGNSTRTSSPPDSGARAVTAVPTYHQLVTYQPADRYWAFQWTELAVYGVAALLLGAFCVWWVRRRRIA